MRPILDLTLLMLGLPMVIGGIERNVFISAGISFGVVGLVHLTAIVCYSLGANSLINPAALRQRTKIQSLFGCRPQQIGIRRAIASIRTRCFVSFDL